MRSPSPLSIQRRLMVAFSAERATHEALVEAATIVCFRISQDADVGGAFQAWRMAYLEWWSAHDRALALARRLLGAAGAATLEVLVYADDPGDVAEAVRVSLEAEDP